MVDLEYQAGSLLPPFPPERLPAFDKWLSHYWEREIRLPRAYAEHTLAFHGGAPRKACFRTPSRRTRMIGRFFNFLERSDLTPPLTPTWRQWSGEPDVRLDYRVKGFLDYEFWCLRLEGTTYLPIAGLDTAGHNCRDMDEINLLCLDYSAGGEPPVVAWEFPGFQPAEVVAPSFADFLPMLRRCPAGAVRAEPENF
jgi:hypothetical protein